MNRLKKIVNSLKGMLAQAVETIRALTGAISVGTGGVFVRRNRVCVGMGSGAVGSDGGADPADEAASATNTLSAGIKNTDRPKQRSRWLARWNLAYLLGSIFQMGLLAPAMAQDDIRWQAATGSWFTAANWIDLSRPDGMGGFLHFVPGPLDSARVANGGTAQIAGGSGAASTLIVEGGSLVLCHTMILG